MEPPQLNPELINFAENTVQETLENLPQQFSSKIENILFYVTDWPATNLAHDLKLSHHYQLFGLYQGIPLPKKPFANVLLPDKITIFVGPILWVSKSWHEFKEKIKNTLLHEIGHYFGLTDPQLKRIEKLKGVEY